MAGATHQSPRRGGKLDDETTALVLHLWRTPRKDGKRRSYREISRECKEQGRPVAHTTVQRLCSMVHQETVEEATTQVRERLTESLDDNVDRMTRIADRLTEAFEKGKWPNGQPISGGVRVMAAKEAINASAQLLSYCGVQEPKDTLNPEQIVNRARRLYGIELEEDDETQDEGSEVTGGAHGSGATTHH